MIKVLMVCLLFVCGYTHDITTEFWNKEVKKSNDKWDSMWKWQKEVNVIFKDVHKTNNHLQKQIDSLKTIINKPSKETERQYDF